jgi:hypothetical protein
MPDHRDRPASALAHGPAKSTDIERARRDVDEADAQSERAEEGFRRASPSAGFHRHAFPFQNAALGLGAVD